MVRYPRQNLGRCTRFRVRSPAREASFLSLGVCLRNLLYELSEDIDSEALKAMIFLLKESLPKVETPVSGSYRVGSL